MTRSTEPRSCSIGTPAHARIQNRHSTLTVTRKTGPRRSRGRIEAIRAMVTSHPHDLNVYVSWARAVPLREKDRLRAVEQELAARDADSHPVAEQARAKMRGGIPALAVRQPRIVVLVLTFVLDEAPHHVRQVLEELRAGVDDEHGTGRVQAVGEDQPLAHARFDHDVAHPRRDVDGLPTCFALHREALPLDLHSRGFDQGRAHGVARSLPYSAKALASTVLSFSTSTGLRRYA